MAGNGKWKWASAFALAALAIGGAALFRNEVSLQAALDWIARLGHWGPILFVGIYAIATVLFVPGSILTLGAGALFGVVPGSIYVSLASTFGATGAFLIGRHLARGWVSQRIARHPRFSAIDKAVEAEGWKIVILTRLSPMFPYSLLNYAFGLTRVSLRDYVIASWLGMMPGTVLYVAIGSLARAGASPQSRSAMHWALSGIGLLATIALTLFLSRIARRALEKSH